MQDRYRQDTGRKGEDRAAGFLNDRGFEVIERNYRYGRYGEIDIIARAQGLLVFVEVKKRTTDSYGGALYAISARKKESFRRAARHFLQKNPSLDTPEITCRFDLISIENDTVEWIEDMFR